MEEIDKEVVDDIIGIAQRLLERGEPVADKVLDLLENAAERYYNVKWSEKIAKGVATFYNQIIEDGVPKELAGKLTLVYLVSSHKDYSKSVLSGIKKGISDFAGEDYEYADF